MAFEITAIDGQAVGPAEALHVVIDPDSDYGLSAEDHWHQRVGIGSTHHGQTPNPRVIDLKVYPGTAAFGGDYTDWVGAAIALCRPTGALHTITGDLGGTEVSIEAAFGRAVLPSGQLACVAVPALAPSQFWRTTGALTSSTSGTSTNNGNAPAAPRITIRPTTGTVLRRRITLTENTGRGLVGHPLRITINTTGASVAAGSDLLLMWQGRPQLFQAQNLNNASTLLDAHFSLKHSGSTFADLLYGAAVTNTVTANQLPPGGFDYAHAAFSNSNWVFRSTATTLNGIAAPSIFQSETAAPVVGTWHNVTREGVTYRSLSTEIDAIASGALQGLHSTYLLSTPQSTVFYRIYGSPSFTAGTFSSSGTPPNMITGAISVPAAVQVLIDTSWTAEPSTAPIEIALESSQVPTITVDSSATTMARINGVLTNLTTGDTITFRDVFIDADASGGLIIDCNAAAGEQVRVYPSLPTSPMYTADGGQGWEFSNPAGFPLVPGANSWAFVGDGAPVITLEHADTWSV